MNNCGCCEANIFNEEPVIAPAENIYIVDGIITDPLRTVSLDGNDLIFSGIGGSSVELEVPNIILDSANINLAQVPITDNTQIDLLVRDSITGQIKTRTVAGLPVVNVFNSNGNLNSNRGITHAGFTWTNSLGNSNFIISGNNGVNGDYNGAAGTITHAAGNNLIFTAPQYTLTTAPAFDNTLNDFLVRNSISGAIQRRSFDSFDHVDFSFIADGGAITTLNRFHYCNTINYFDTADTPLSIGGMDRFSTGWAPFYTIRPSSIAYAIQLSPMSSLAPVNLASPNVFVDLYYVNPSLVQRVAGSAVLVITNSFTLGVDSGSNTILTPAFYPGAVGGSQWTLVVRNPNANNFNLTGHIKFFRG